MLLVAFEPEDEAGAIFLRLRKAIRKKGLRSSTLAPYLSNGTHKLDATLVPTVPGAEAAALLRCRLEVPPTPDSVILVGERAAWPSGTLTACLRAGRAHRRPAGLGARAGPATAARSRPAACPTCCPAAVRWPTPPARVDTADHLGHRLAAAAGRAATPTRC